MPETPNDFWRVECRIPEDGEPWTVRSVHATEDAANTRRDEQAAEWPRLDWRAIPRADATA